MKKQGKRGYKKRRGEDRGRGSEGTKQDKVVLKKRRVKSYHKTEGGAQRGQNKKRWVRRRGRYNLITRQREGIRGDKTGI